LLLLHRQELLCAALNDCNCKRDRGRRRQQLLLLRRQRRRRRMQRRRDNRQRLAGYP